MQIGYKLFTKDKTKFHDSELVDIVGKGKAKVYFIQQYSGVHATLKASEIDKYFFTDCKVKTAKKVSLQKKK